MIPYYSDPSFLAKAPGVTMQNMVPGSAAPFAATTAAVRSTLAKRREQANQLGILQQRAGAQYQNAQFQNNLARQAWQGNVGRAAQNISAQEQLVFNRNQEAMRRAAEKKARKRGKWGAVVGGLGSIAGAVAGNMIAPGFGGAIGAQIGGRLGQSAGGF